VAAVAVQLTGAPVVPAAPRPEALVAIAWLAVGPSATAAVLVVAGMQRLEARHASVFLLLNPPTAAILAYLLLGERLSALQLVGGACVLVAIAAASGLVVLRDRRR
jgi:DME family drug/metabolite transporter